MDVNVTLAGFVGTTPRLFTSQNGTPFTSFRVASTKRYLDRSSNAWVDGKTIWFTVKAWRQPATNVAESVRKGDAVVVTGRLAVDEWTADDGPRTDLVVEATALGPDLTRGTARFAHTVARRDERATDAAAGEVGDPAPDVEDSAAEGEPEAEEARSDDAAYAMSA
ncbi:single-strand DNA-binding protein [Paraoerskovia marina]|uniref:Single-stranded DNA-binding protein n=1 Tax=Paraoerskovia marina TaxID=545619 RepID=A0A1H1UAN5_9CELL|nr:single-stranded DNA-binding protein [Paraoerskovia marina]SDS69538.1 single-strand DNA-binding protein [Paraoerskovia marina]